MFVKPEKFSVIDSNAYVVEEEGEHVDPLQMFIKKSKVKRIMGLGNNFEKARELECLRNTENLYLIWVSISGIEWIVIYYSLN